MNFSIAIIEPTGEELIEQSTISDMSQVVKESIINLINKLNITIRLIDVKTPSDMMEKSVEIIGMTPDTLGITTTCYEDKDYIYQMLHLDTSAFNNQHNQENSMIINAMNTIASAISYDKVRIFGRAVMFKSAMRNDSNNEFKPCSITIGDIKNILEKRSRHLGILVQPTGVYEEKEYYIDPIECCENIISSNDTNVENDNKTLKTHNQCFVGFNVVFVYDESHDKTENNNNHLMSSFIGEEIYGPVFAFIKSGDYDFLNLSANMFEKFKTIINNGNIDKLKEECNFKYIISQYRKLNDFVEN